MKFRIKLLTVAIATALTTGAHAAITTSATGNGELFFTVYDVGADLSSSADDRAYVRDLGSLFSGGTINDWVSATTTAPLPALNANKQSFGTTYSLGADANLQSFLSTSTDASRLKWNIAAADSSGTDRFLTTAGAISAAQAPTYAQFRTFANRTDTFLAGMNSALTGQSALYSGAGAAINQWGSNLGGAATFSTSAGFGDRMGFYVLSERIAFGSSTTKADVRQFRSNSNYAMEWTLASNGELSYGHAIVPLGAPAYYSSPVPGETIEFGTVAIGSSKDATLDVGNWNIMTMTIYDAKITGEDGESFQVKNFTPGMTVEGNYDYENGVYLNPLREPFHLGIEFDPNRIGEHHAALTLYTDSVFDSNGMPGDSVFSYNLHAVAAIPEPSEYALMLTGLGFFGFMARRRKYRYAYPPNISPAGAND